MDIELTNEAITKAVERCGEFTPEESNIRLGVTDSGCAGYEYVIEHTNTITCLLYTSPSPRDATLSRMPSSA